MRGALLVVLALLVACSSPPAPQATPTPASVPAQGADELALAVPVTASAFVGLDLRGRVSPEALQPALARALGQLRGEELSTSLQWLTPAAFVALFDASPPDWKGKESARTVTLLFWQALLGLQPGSKAVFGLLVADPAEALTALKSWKAYTQDDSAEQPTFRARDGRPVLCLCKQTLLVAYDEAALKMVQAACLGQAPNLYAHPLYPQRGAGASVVAFRALQGLKGARFLYARGRFEEQNCVLDMSWGLDRGAKVPWVKAALTGPGRTFTLPARVQSAYDRLLVVDVPYFYRLLMLDQASREKLTEYERMFGVSFEKDILPLLRGELGLAGRPGGKNFFGFDLLLAPLARPSAVKTLERKVTSRLQLLLGQQNAQALGLSSLPGFTVFGKPPLLGLGPNQAVLEQAITPASSNAAVEADRSLRGCCQNLRNLATGYRMYSQDNEDVYPRELGTLTPNYLQKLPTCPAAGTVTYAAELGEEISFTLRCAGTHHPQERAPDYPRYDYQLRHSRQYLDAPAAGLPLADGPELTAARSDSPSQRVYQDLSRFGSIQALQTDVPALFQALPNATQYRLLEALDPYLMQNCVPRLEDSMVLEYLTVESDSLRLTARCPVSAPELATAAWVLATIFDHPDPNAPSPPATECGSVLKDLTTALEMYSTDNAGRYPVGLSALTPSYLETIPTCPQAGRLTYTYEGAANPDVYTVVCAEAVHPRALRYSSVGGLEEAPPPPELEVTPVPPLTECFRTVDWMGSYCCSYYNDNGVYPSSLESLTPKYVDELPTCPLGGPYELESRPGICTVYCAGKHHEGPANYPQWSSVVGAVKQKGEL